MTNEEYIHDLQSRISFQEDTLNTLNERVAEQEKTIIMLQKQLQHIYKKMKTLEMAIGDSDQHDVPPPHY
ncbi:SlyX family protein [Agarilytica rhodophyticola]|uniref:SlyX family protein n=1 Tax=Agarilytica rhodophyticola TaxID=1737490 RepID=UPI000B345459|nr:SlyX family protein [Agarilytica rhodophyticola]